MNNIIAISSRIGSQLDRVVCTGSKNTHALAYHIQPTYVFNIHIFIYLLIYAGFITLLSVSIVEKHRQLITDLKG